MGDSNVAFTITQASRMPLTKANMQMNPKELFDARTKLLIEEYNNPGIDHPVESLSGLFHAIYNLKPKDDRQLWFEFLAKIAG